MGNRLTRRLASVGTTTTDTYSYPATSNRLQSVAGGQARTFTYDAAGNITYDNRSGTGFGYGYNAKNRMESISINGVVQSEFAYNALGQQVIRRLTVGGQTIHSVHDADGNRVAEYKYDPGTQISTLLREYVWMNGENVAVVEGGVVYYVRTDHIGRPVFATDDSGAKVWEASHLPFGSVHTSTGSNSNLRFPGQWFQSEAGLHQNWMRDYDPTTGRYIQADPLGLVDGASVYGYVRQNPGRYVDPKGENAIGRKIFDGIKKGVEWCKENVRVQGPDNNLFKNGHGRIMQLLLKKNGKKKPFFRLDYAEHFRGQGKELHCHCGFDETYVPLDPRPKSWRSPR